MRQQIIDMLDLQDAMNTRVHPRWREQNFAWYRAVWVECAELMDHYGWKWWKKQTPDMDQVKLELIDIWHFGLSLLLVENQDVDAIVNRVVAAIEDAPGTGNFREDLEAFTESTLHSRSFDIAGFATLMDGVGLDFDELYARYIGKNMLNLFRQEKGYQQGTYRKTWQGREDNEHLMEIINELDRASTDFRDAVYRSLEFRYNSMDSG
ncbi:MAG: dUTP diphosphatase [Porticoccaceae bacterium]|nr:dUTP diphosphatase [Porticoccaceae bacterium]